MTHLEVPGASLYHEIVGEGPMLLCISGADGSCEIWRGFAEYMKSHFKVVMWDRRGFSRSYLKGAQDYSQRLETDADDAARLIQHISPNEPATVIGNSSGAIVSLRLLTRHPNLLRTLIPYEPPAAKLMPNYDDIWRKHHEVYNTYRASGIHPALEGFAELTKADQRMIGLFLDFSKPFLFSNLQYWFEREFMYYPNADFDVEHEIRAFKDKLLIVNGELSPHDVYQYRANAIMAEELGMELVHLPGEHVGHATHAEQFSKKLLEALKSKDEYYAKV